MWILAQTEVLDLAKQFGVTGALLLLTALWFQRVLLPRLWQEQADARVAFKQEQSEQRKAHAEQVDRLLANDHEEHSRMLAAHEKAVADLIQDSRESRKEILAAVKDLKK